MRSLFLHSLCMLSFQLIKALSLSLSLPCRLRTLSSGSGSSSNNTSGGGGGSGGTNAGPPSPTKLPLSSSSSASRKLHFKMAEHRYGKEELLQLFFEDPSRPPGMPKLFPITREKFGNPLAFMPLSEEEQVLYM